MNTVVQEELSYIIKEHPDLESRIRDAYNNSEQFRTLCNDYFLCLKTLNQINTRTTQNIKMLGEYTALKKELEKEISIVLVKSSKNSNTN